MSADLNFYVPRNVLIKEARMIFEKLDIGADICYQPPYF